MAKLFYSMAGEGRGHAARARTLAEQLCDDHELWLFAPDDAYDFLARSYGPERLPSAVRLVRIPGLRFHYTQGKLDLLKSIRRGLAYAWGELPPLVQAFRQRLRDERPDLVITDFEPALARAARAEALPYISFNHQHVLLAYDLRSLPSALQWHAWSMSWAVRWYAPGPSMTIATSFYSPPLKRGWEHVRQVGPILRREILAARPVRGDSLLSYLRANTPPVVLDMFASQPIPVKVYGLGERPPLGSVTFCPIDDHQFVSDLAGCRAVVAAAGNQLLGESLYLGKPVLAIPEERHHEQQINAHFIRTLGVGDWTLLDGLTRTTLDRFLEREAEFHQALAPLQGSLNGTATVLDLIQSQLPSCHDEHALAAEGLSAA